MLSLHGNPFRLLSRSRDSHMLSPFRQGAGHDGDSHAECRERAGRPVRFWNPIGDVDVTARIDREIAVSWPPDLPPDVLQLVLAGEVHT